MFTDNKDFYPTPRKLIEEMLKPYEHWDGEYCQGLQTKYKKVLEPSAGKGDIIDYLREKNRYGNRVDIYALEKDIMLQEIIKGKHALYLGPDFLEYDEDINFDLIVMNPPFSEGVDHLLKAWEIARNTDIVCILNAETIKNPCTKKRELLANIILDNGGTVEYRQDEFSEAERKTNVEIAIVRVSKKQEKSDFDFDMKTERPDILEEDFEDRSIMSPDKLGSIISQYKEAKETMKVILKNMSKLDKITKQLLGRDDMIRDILGGYGGKQEKYDSFSSMIKIGVWRDLIEKSKIEKYMTTNLRKNFEEYVNGQKNIQISKENIIKFIEFVMVNRSSILETSIEEVFDELTKYDKENRYFPEGWKTNDNWKVNRKFIVSWIGLNYDKTYSSESYRWSFHGSQKLEDIDKVMCYITGKDYYNTKSTADTIKDGTKGGMHGTWIDSTFFRLKYYKKGSVHLEFRDEWLWKEFNMRACSRKNWLPKSEKDAWENSKKDLTITS